MVPTVLVLTVRVPLLAVTTSPTMVLPSTKSISLSSPQVPIPQIKAKNIAAPKPQRPVSVLRGISYAVRFC